MIRIQEHLRRPDAERFLDLLAKSLWKELNPVHSKTKKLKRSSLIEKCRKYVKLTSGATYLKSIANNDKNAATRHKKFLRYLLANRARNLRRVITSRPSEFAILKGEVFNIINAVDLFTGNINDPSQTPFGKLLSENIFNYKKFRSSVFCRNMLRSIGFGTTSCPYCNYHELDIVTINTASPKNIKEEAYLDLDHFYPKSQNPFFALSFFNLIPSCHICNQKIKRDQPFAIESHINPYVDSFDDYYIFKISLKTILGSVNDSITIESKGLPRVDFTVRDLQLESRYMHHFQRIRKIIETFENYKFYIGTPDEKFFVEMITDGVPLIKSEIISVKEGKLKRDILNQIDINGVLKII